MWDWAIWAALIVAAAVGMAALALLVARSLKAWRALTQTRRAIVGGLDELSARAQAVVDRLAAGTDTAELQENLGRLRISLARLAVLRAAIAEADETFGRFIVVAPHK
jgi:hypothetical protein